MKWVHDSVTFICFVEGLCNIYVICIYLHILVFSTISISRCSCRLTVIRRVPHVEQEPLTEFTPGCIFVICIYVYTSFFIFPRARVAQWVRMLNYLTTHTSLSPIRRGFAPGFVNCKKGALDSQPQMIKFTSCLSIRDGRWFSPGTPASFTTKTGRHDIAEILLKMALNTINQIKSNHGRSRG